MSNFDPYTVGEAIAAQVVKLAEFERDTMPVDGASAAIVSNIIIAAQRALTAGKACLNDGDTQAALFALGAVDGAFSLINGLLTNSDDKFMQEMATPFAVGLDSEVQQ